MEILFQPVNSLNDTEKYHDQYVGVVVEDLTVSNSIDIRNDKTVIGIEFIYPTSICLKQLRRYTNLIMTNKVLFTLLIESFFILTKIMIKDILILG
ncbi:hypothetical protein KHA80_10780 [Anaerobacillus sp. HL2]|nr:hypothetical protein KHA80_10780 [Anaerobacillus sp. HL2]